MHGYYSCVQCNRNKVTTNVMPNMSSREVETHQHHTACQDVSISSIHVLGCGESCTSDDARLCRLNINVTEFIVHIMHAIVHLPLQDKSYCACPSGKVKSRSVTLSVLTVTLTTDKQPMSSNSSRPVRSCLDPHAPPAIL